MQKAHHTDKLRANKRAVWITSEFLQNYIKSYHFHLWEFESGYKTQMEPLQEYHPDFF